MYNDIAANRRKTWGLIVLFTIVLVAIGWAFGVIEGNAEAGILLAVIVSTIMSLVSYYAGDSVALASSGAHQIEKHDAPDLWNTVENLCIADGLPMPKVYLINDPSPNAFATGRDPQHASIAVTTGLLQLMEPVELEGVIAHELSHVKNLDIRVMTVVVVLVGAVVLLSDWLLRAGFRKQDRDVPPILALIGIVLAILSPLFAELIKLAVSRSREYLADASGALLTRYPEGLARALEKIAAYDRPLARANHATAHLFLANPFDPHVTAKFESMFSTHPPILERVKRLREMGR